MSISSQAVTYLQAKYPNQVVGAADDGSKVVRVDFASGVGSAAQASILADAQSQTFSSAEPDASSFKNAVIDAVRGGSLPHQVRQYYRDYADLAFDDARRKDLYSKWKASAPTFMQSQHWATFEGLASSANMPVTQGET